MSSEDIVSEIKHSYFKNCYAVANNIIPLDILKYLDSGMSVIFNAHYVDYFGDDDMKYNTASLVHDKNNSTSQGFYNNILSETLAVYLTPIFQQLTGKNLAPTYTYIRKYYRGQVLDRHRDRESCQYSVTVPINKQAADWLFYGVDAHDQHPTLREIKCDLGGAIFYMGERLSHWRKELQSD